MTSERRIIGGHRFTNEADYQAAERDLNKIEEIRKKIDFSNQQSLEGLYNDLQTGHITFESIIGQEFDDEVYEAYTNLKGKNGFVKDNIVSKTDKSQSSVKKTAKVKDAGKRISLDDFDEEMQARIVKELNKKERLRKGILITCGIIAACSLLYFAVYEFMTLRTNRDAQALAEAIKDDDGYYSTLKPGDDKYYAQLTETEEGTPVVLHKYEDLYNQNKSLIGWVKIADTVIDYPVMQTVNNEYYLDHNFHQEYDKNGSIFLDASCSVYPRSTNLIIYGHHMKSGKMFGSLQSYQNESYYKEH